MRPNRPTRPPLTGASKAAASVIAALVVAALVLGLAAGVLLLARLVWSLL